MSETLADDFFSYIILHPVEIAKGLSSGQNVTPLPRHGPERPGALQASPALQAGLREMRMAIFFKITRSTPFIEKIDQILEILRRPCGESPILKERVMVWPRVMATRIRVVSSRRNSPRPEEAPKTPPESCFRASP